MGQMPTRAENPFNIFWHRNFSNLPTKFLLLGKRIMIYTKKLRDVTPPVQAKALLLLQKYLQHFLIWKFVKSTYKVYSSGKKKNDFYKKASPCNTASTGKSTTATACKSIWAPKAKRSVCAAASSGPAEIAHVLVKKQHYFTQWQTIQQI